LFGKKQFHGRIFRHGLNTERCGKGNS
jgi:hypothetical protein